MSRIALLFLLLMTALPKLSQAQSGPDVRWVQIEARPSYSAALEKAEVFAKTLQDVNGFQLRGGWFAIALGPYTPNDAEIVLRSYRAQGLIPNDSYIAVSEVYGQQYWPAGEDILGRGRIAGSGIATTAPKRDTPNTEPVEQKPGVEPKTDPETLAQARQNERQLSRQDRRDLQIALKWAGHYNAAIDGAFGRGTRRSMAAWQSANSVEPTGVLTTRQRALLWQQYNAILDGLDMKLLRDQSAGIEVKVPAAAVGFARYEAPFAHYDATSSLPSRVLLISQKGSRNTLRSLYDIMQTLAIVPLDGERRIRGDKFTLIGLNAKIVSETHVERVGDEIKGFTLIWPAGDEARRSRVLEEMRGSFSRLNGVLDPSAGVEDQQIDLFSGLKLRKPLLSRSGFYVDESGAVVTTSDAVQNCSRITLDETYDATLSRVDADRGIAVLKPSEAIAPPAVALFSAVPPRMKSEVAVAGFSFEGQLNAASVTFGTLSDLKGLQGERDLSRLELETLPGDAGGPVIDRRGNVLGMLLPQTDSTRQLPRSVQFALNGEAIAQVLQQAGLKTRKSNVSADLDPVDIADRGTGMTVLVSCWE